jgi:hypothetical protein
LSLQLDWKLLNLTDYYSDDDYDDRDNGKHDVPGGDDDDDKE